MPQSQSAQWSSNWAFILAATGAAVGLGNIWRFPYMAGVHGGSAFVGLYLIFVLLMGIPIMISEFIIGRHGRENPIDTLRQLALNNQHSHHWGLLGAWGGLALLMILSFYSVVSGWSIAYIFKSLLGTFDHANAQQVNQIWQTFLASPGQLIAWHSLFMILTMLVITAGVSKGLERATKLMMPALYLILLALVLYASHVGHFAQAARFLFHFDPSKITPSVTIAAMGHAFFTLAIGAVALLTYGAYIPPRTPLIPSVFFIVVLDVLVAVLSGLAIFPIVFTYHLPVSQGPGLMFVSLPISFNHLPMGNWVGALFFVLLLFAAWTSSINLAEPLIVILMEKYQLSRKQAAWIVGSAAWLLGLGSALSFNVLQSVTFFQQYHFFDLATNIPTDFLLPIGGIGFAIVAGYIMKKTDSQAQIYTHRAIYRLWRFLVRTVAPLVVLCILLSPLITLTHR